VLRTVAIAVAVENLLLGSVFSIMVLIAGERLGVRPVGYGLLLSASAVGGILGGLLAGRIVALLGPGTTIRAGLVLETACYLGLAFTRVAWLAGLIIAMLGLHLVIFSTINATMRQSLTPPDMLGRVHSAYRMLSSGGMLAGAALGGLTAGAFGLTAPFWIGVTVVATLAVSTWPILTNSAITAAQRDSAPPPD